MCSDQTTTGTTLSSIVEQALAAGSWWQEAALDQPTPLVLPTRILHALDNAGISTVEQLKAAGPAKIRGIEHLGKQGFELVVEFLRALDKQNGASNGGDHQSGQTGVRGA